MRVVHVVRSDAFAGVERYISLVAPRLAARGCDVTVIGGDRLPMAAALGRDRPGAGTAGGAVHWRPAATTWQAVAALARSGRTDIVHAHMTAAEVAAVVTRPLHRGRLVATLHFAVARGSASGRPVLAHLGRVIDEQIAISRFVASTLPATRVLPNGVEIADAGPAERDRMVLVMQRLEPEKRTDVALRAWSRCGLRHRGWSLVIAGRGQERPSLERLAAELGISATVEWAGFVEHGERLLARAAAVVATAPAEPFGLTVVEAMARATPVVAADGGAHRETVGDDGWLFPAGDVDACARLLDGLDSVDSASYGARLQERQRRSFAIEAHTDALLDVYRGLLR